MRFLAIVTLLLATACLTGEDKSDSDPKVDAQKKAAIANWEAVDAGPEAVHETKRLILIGPKSAEKRLPAIGTLLEKAHDVALKPLAFEKDQPPYLGKITVYLFGKVDDLRSFIRRVERRRLDGEEFATYSAKDEMLHAAAAQPRGAGDLSIEGQAATQLAALLLVRRAGLKTPVDGWLIEGFGRATWYRTAPTDRGTAADRRAAQRLSRLRSARDVYGGLVEAAEAPPLRGTLAEFLAYGPGSAKFPALLKGFEPEENMDSRSTEQALESAGLKWDAIDRGWKAFASVGR